jgi:hypothetical protein
MLAYKVCKKYLRGSEQEIGRFLELNDAKLFIQAKLESDAGYKVEVTYLLYDFDDLVEECAAGSQHSAGGSSQSGQQAQTQSFSPSPLQVAPRPSGMPPSSFKDILQKNEDKK